MRPQRSWILLNRLSVLWWFGHSVNTKSQLSWLEYFYLRGRSYLVAYFKLFLRPSLRAVLTPMTRREVSPNLQGLGETRSLSAFDSLGGTFGVGGEQPIGNDAAEQFLAEKLKQLLSLGLI